MDWTGEAHGINAALHESIGEESCETGCTHYVTPKWSMLGLARVAARARWEAENRMTVTVHSAFDDGVAAGLRRGYEEGRASKR